MADKWYFDSWDVTLGGTRDVESAAGWVHVAAEEGEDLDIPNRHGRIYVPGKLPPAQVSLTIWLAGATEEDVHAEWDLLVRAAAPVGRLVKIQRTKVNGRSRYAWGRMTGVAQPVLIGRRGYRVTLTFTLPDGMWFDTAAQTSTSSTSSALPKTLPLTGNSEATAPIVDLTYQVFGPITNPKVTDRTNGVTGDSFTYYGTIPPGGNLLVANRSWQVTGTGFTVNQAALIPTGRTPCTVSVAAPGQVPTVELAGSSGGTTTKLVVVARSSYRSS